MPFLAGAATAIARSRLMFKDHSSSAIVAVRDMGRARGFYGDVLGLELLGDSMKGVLAFRTGLARLTNC